MFVQMRQSGLKGLIILLGLFGCTSSSEQQTTDWAVRADSTHAVTIRESANMCSDCIELERAAVLGDSADGALVETIYLRRDSLGRYWVHQQPAIKLFDSTGRYVGTVGRAGRGPMEFLHPVPVYTDSAGNMHVFDPELARETVVGPDLKQRAMRSVPSGDFSEAMAIPGTDEYVANFLSLAGESASLPLHIMRGGEIVHSFGDKTAGNAMLSYKFERHLAVDMKGRIFSSHRFAFQIDAWSPSGQRLATFLGPTLNESEVKETFYNRTNNPIPNEIKALSTDGAGHLWILSYRPRPNWRDYYVDRRYGPNMVGLVLKEGKTMDSSFTARLEVVDLSTAQIVARRELPGLFTSFVGPGLLFQYVVDDNGTPQVVVWRARLQRR
jgi:hypothetical protein